jgi:hypothetical protein
MKAVFAAIAIAFASASAIASGEKPTVVFDAWWTVDFAKNGCRLLDRPLEACKGDAEGAVHDFTDRLLTKVASNPVCSTVTFVWYRSPTETNKAQADAIHGEHWTLGIDFTVGNPTQSWWMKQSGNHVEILKGEGTPAEIAKEVCAIVSKRGAKVLN